MMETPHKISHRFFRRVQSRTSDSAAFIYEGDRHTLLLFDYCGQRTGCITVWAFKKGIHIHAAAPHNDLEMWVPLNRIKKAIKTILRFGKQINERVEEMATKKKINESKKPAAKKTEQVQTPPPRVVRRKEPSAKKQLEEMAETISRLVNENNVLRRELERAKTANSNTDQSLSVSQMEKRILESLLSQLSPEMMDAFKKARASALPEEKEGKKKKKKKDKKKNKDVPAE